MHNIKPEVRQALVDLVRREGDKKILEIALLLNRTRASGVTRAHSNLFVQQMVNGFVSVTLEAIAGEGGEARLIFFETLIASLRAAGSSAYNLVQWNGTYVTLLAAELMPLLPAEVRAEGTEWFAYFSGVYLGDVMLAALTPSDRRSVNP